MKSLREDYYNPLFSHIYVETAIKDHPRTQKLLAKFPSAEIVEISHYKDVFCRGRQSRALQHRSQSLILAARRGTLLYGGAPVCQSFGNPYFYYASCVMNCIFDCEYCYLQGMYPSANIVVFVNLEDYFAQAERMLESHPLYLCVSYDTDLLALEHVTGYVEEWCGFARKHEDLKLEIRTKCAGKRLAARLRPLPGVIYALTLSPQAVIEAFEHHTPSLSARLSFAKELIRAGCLVRFCFDPMIYLPGWEQHYAGMLEQVYDTVDMDQILDVSVGTFRIPQDYLKKMRKQKPGCAAVWFPFQNENGYYHYPKALMEEMEHFLVHQLEQKVPKEKIFQWKE